MLDAQGTYRGVIPLDEMCLVEYQDFLEAVPERGLGDGESIFLNEWKATAIYGEKIGIITISKGSLGSEEVQWARHALVAAEAMLLGKLPPPPRLEDDDQQQEEDDQTQAAVAAVARSLDEREKLLRKREEAVKVLEQRPPGAVESHRKEMEAQIADLKERIEVARTQHLLDMGTLAAERDRLRRELEAASSRASKGSAWAPREAGLEEAQEKLAEERKSIQKKAQEFREREDTLRDRERHVEEESRRLAIAREQIDQRREEIETMKAAAPPAFDHEAAKREIDQRVMILQQKAFDLMAREEQLKKRAEEIQALLSTT